jgi:hypothetical protein
MPVTVGVLSVLSPTAQNVITYAIHFLRPRAPGLRHPVFLTLNGVPGEEELASAFRSAWRLLPPAARKKILDYWYSPCVEVVDDLPADRPGEFRCYGLDLRFLGPACATMPAPACVGLVLLQLAHVYQCAKLEPHHRSAIDLTVEARRRCEGIAISTVALYWDLEHYIYAQRNWMREQASGITRTFRRR